MKLDLFCKYRKKKTTIFEEIEKVFAFG